MRVGVGGRWSLADCRCVVCCVPHVKRALNKINDVSEEAKGIFADAISGVDPGTYKSLMRLSDSQDLESVSYAGCLARFTVVLAVSLMVILVASVVFVVLLNKGIVHIPGSNPEMIASVTRWVGAGLCMVSFSYLLLGVGYLIGGSSVGDDDKKYKAIRALDRSRIRKLAVDQKEQWDNLRRDHKELQSKVVSLKKSVTRSKYKDVWRLPEFVHAEGRYEELSDDIASATVELRDVKGVYEKLRLDYDEIAEKNARLSENNLVIKGKLRDMDSSDRRKFGGQTPTLECDGDS